MATMTIEEFNALIAAEENCSDELYTARKKRLEVARMHSWINDIYFICNSMGANAEEISFVAKDFFSKTASAALETLRDLDLIRQSLELKIKTLEEQSS